MTHPAPLSPSDIPLQPGPPFNGNLRAVATGEWAGWYQWGEPDPFEQTTGPFYVARDASGIITGFRSSAHNRNAHGMIHGGALMTFADFSLFNLGTPAGASLGEEIHGVTVSMTSEFLYPAQAGQLLIGRGERTGGGRSLIIARGVITADGRPVLSFSGVIRQFAPRSA